MDDTIPIYTYTVDYIILNYSWLTFTCLAGHTHPAAFVPSAARHVGLPVVAQRASAGRRSPTGGGRRPCGFNGVWLRVCFKGISFGKST